jgi:hypothetical protein
MTVDGVACIILKTGLLCVIGVSYSVRYGSVLFRSCDNLN